jgi:D-alanyl-D-alanine carboxypeptidase
MQSNIKNIISAVIISLSLLSLGGFILAQEIAPDEALPANPLYYINLDKKTIDKGYTVSAFEDKIKLSLTPGILSDATGVEVLEMAEPIDAPWQLDKISKIYQFEFKNKLAYDNAQPFYIQFGYNKSTNNFKQVFFYDKNYNAWRPLPTRDFPREKFVRSLIHLPFARIAVFDYPDILTLGKASWYKFKNGNFAASPDFPAGSLLRVYNSDNNKFVDVEINDYGPERDKHPDRVLDLDKVAFKKLASLNSGVINIRVEPLYIKPANGAILGIASSGAASQLKITAKSAIAINEETGDILFAKNATSTLPLASLTKLVAIKVFLDTKPTLNKAVAYSVKDEEYNYQYADKWESARLKMEEGETLTVEDLIYASLVGSANNTVETLVRISGVLRDEFIAQMNEIVKNWGAAETSFVEPTGLAPENVSSALDYAIITKEVMKNPIIEKASKAGEYKFYSTKISKKKISHRIINTNKLIGANYFHIAGSKTGYLDEAGFCLMTRVLAPSGHIIAVTLGAPTREASFNEMEDLIRYGLRKIK